MPDELKHVDIEIPYGATPLEHISFKGCTFRSNGTFWRKPGSQTTLFQLEYVLWLKMKQKVQMNQVLAERVRTAESISSWKPVGREQVVRFQMDQCYRPRAG